MQFSPGFFGSIITGSGSWVINLDKRELLFRIGSKRAVRIDYPSVTSVNVKPGLVWANVKIWSSGQFVEFDGITNDAANLFKSTLVSRVADSLLQLLNKNSHAIRMLADSLDEFLCLPKYLAHGDITQWFARHESTSNPHYLYCAIPTPLRT